jgi:probable rRNA maturation factor
VLSLEGRPGWSLSVTYVSPSRMRELNSRYKGSERDTDVLAFSMTEGRRLRGAEGYLGDIVISPDAARRQAGTFGSTEKEELKLYLIHGILHLLGYDDEDPAARGRMERRQEELARRL